MTVRVIHSDNMSAMLELEREEQRFALAYCDSPFFTQETHKTTDGEVAFDDHWESLHDFVGTVCRAACRAWELLIPEGSVVLHVDSKTSHHLKVAMDASLGRSHFASEIIWRYRRWPAPTRNFQRVHDVLLRYVKDPKVEPRWNQLYEPLSPKTAEQWGQQKQRAVMTDGERARSSSTDEASPGAPLGDVWDIGIVGPSSDERNGFPTQKPEKLLERLILSLTNEGDSVLSPYMGSGTDLAVAHRLRRHAVGIDSSAVAVRIARDRLAPSLAQAFLFEPEPSR